MTRMLRICLLIAVTASSVVGRHVYPFHYTGAMPDMVHMVDDPRQVGIDEPLIEPPRYGAKLRDLKTHDFYPHDPQESDDGSYPAATGGGIRGRVPYPGNAVPTGAENVITPAAFPQLPGLSNSQNRYIPGLQGFQPGPVELPPHLYEQIPSQTHTGVLYPQQQNQGRLQCFATGTLRNEAMDAWCVINCNHTPSYCPATHCICSAYKKK